ncbi:MAG: rod shape-determining protein RodA, partial [Actinomycetota bacterium]
MAMTFLERRTDRGLGNIRSSPGDPSRNIDWVLMIAHGALTVAGCFIVFSASWTTVDGDPYAFVTRQVLFAIAGYVVMFAVMAFDYDVFRQR